MLNIRHFLLHTSSKTYIHFEVVVKQNTEKIHLKQKQTSCNRWMQSIPRVESENKNIKQTKKHKKTMLLLLFVIAFGSGNFSAGDFFPCHARSATLIQLALGCARPVCTGRNRHPESVTFHTLFLNLRSLDLKSSKQYFNTLTHFSLVGNFNS